MYWTAICSFGPRKKHTCVVAVRGNSFIMWTVTPNFHETKIKRERSGFVWGRVCTALNWGQMWHHLHRPENFKRFCLHTPCLETDLSFFSLFIHHRQMHISIAKSTLPKWTILIELLTIISSPKKNVCWYWYTTRN